MDQLDQEFCLGRRCLGQNAMAEVAFHAAEIAQAFYRLDEGLYGTNAIIYWQGPKLTTSQIGVLRNYILVL